MGKLGYYVGKTTNPLTGEEVYAAKLAKYSEFGTREVIDYAVQNAQVSAQALAVGMAALTDAINNFVLNGHSVTLDGLGCFSVSAKTGIWNSKFKKWTSAGKNNMDEVSTDDIKGIYVRFKPCTDLRRELRTTEFFDIMDQELGKQYAGVSAAYLKTAKEANAGG